MFGLPGLLSNNDSGNTCLPSSQHALEDWTPFALDLDCSKPNLLGHGRHAEVYRAILHPSSSPMRQYLLARKSKHTMLCKDLLQLDAPSDDSSNASFTCAAKCLFSDADSQSQGLAEAKILRRLHTEQSMHPGRQYLVNCYGIYDKTTQQAISCVDGTAPDLDTLSEPHDREWVLLLEYCQNGTIWDWIRQHPERVGHRQWLDWAIQLLQAVSCIHEAGLIHHDIKPHNILVSPLMNTVSSHFSNDKFKIKVYVN
jgi:serine/threonine protein kinase